jgi:hypothetical protein
MNQKIFSSIIDDDELTPEEKKKVEKLINKLKEQTRAKNGKKNLSLIAFGFNSEKLKIEPFKPNVIGAIFDYCSHNGYKPEIIYRLDKGPGFYELIVN